MSLADTDSFDEMSNVATASHNYAVIRQRHIPFNTDGLDACELLEEELERALSEGAETIVIEPTRLGEATARWIVFGDCLHRTAILTGLGSIIGAQLWPEKPFVYSPLAAVGVLCSLVYRTSWQSDAAIKYRVERRLDRDPAIGNIVNLTASPQPVVLVRRRDLSACLYRNGDKESVRIISLDDSDNTSSEEETAPRPSDPSSKQTCGTSFTVKVQRLVGHAANLFHTAVTLIAVSFSSWRLYELVRFSASA